MRIPRFFALLIALAFLPLAPAMAQPAASLAGQWQGVYGYDGQAEQVPFEATIRVDRNRIAGETIERNTFGAADAAFLPATIAGEVRGSNVRFAKTYDGTAGQNHSVQYDGDLQPGGRRIVGRWSLAGASGTFELAR